MNNNSNSNSTTQDLTTYYEYVTIGSAAIATNLLVVFVLLRNTHLLKKSAFFAGLAIGDILDGVALFGNGVRRIVMAHAGTLSGTVHPSYCMQTFSPIFILGNQIPGVMFFLIGLERFLAVHNFDWYFTKWTPKLAWKYTGAAYAFCVVSLIVAYIVTYLQPASARIPIACNTPSVMGHYYATYNYSVAIVGGTVAIVFTVVAMVIFTQRKNRFAQSNVSSSLKARVKKEYRQTRIMLWITVLDLGLVVVPNILITLSNGLSLISINGTWSLQVISMRSVLNIFIYVFVNIEFRIATLKAFWLSKMISTVEPVTGIGAGSQMKGVNTGF